MFENHRTLRAKRAAFTFWLDKNWLEMPKIVNFGEFLKTWNMRSNSVTRQVNFNRTKISGKCKNWKTQMWHFDWFSNTVSLKMSHFTKLPELKNRHFWRFTNTMNDLFLRNKSAEKTPRWWIWHLESWYFVTKRLKQKWCQHSGARGRKIVIFKIKSRQH